MTIEEDLQKDFPEATAAECKRFAIACRDDKKDADAIKLEAEKMLEEYLDWRSCYGMDYKKEKIEEDADDAGDWKRAVQKALRVAESMKRAKDLEHELKKEELKKKAGSDKDVVKVDPYAELDKMAAESSNASEGDTGNDKADGEEGKAESTENAENDKEPEKEEEPVVKTLPQLIYLHRTAEGNPVTDKSGTSILHVLPAQVDRKLAASETYCLAFAFYLESKFDRDSDEKMTVIVDVRPGEGWSNPAAVTLVNFIRKVSHMMQANFPERLERLILFPMPTAALMVWGVVKRFMSNNTTKKIALVYGPALLKSPVPKELLGEHVDESVLNKMEEKRVGIFKPIGSY